MNSRITFSISGVVENEAILAKVMEAAYDAHFSGRTVSRYANTSPEEWFAETLSAYLLWPNELKEFDPKAYSAMHSVIPAATN